MTTPTTDAAATTAMLEEAAREKDEALLHRPDRLQQIRGLDQHVETTANLARALWAHLAALAGGDPANLQLCERDVLGLLELADTLADHASAARFCHARDIA